MNLGRVHVVVSKRPSVLVCQGQRRLAQQSRHLFYHTRMSKTYTLLFQRSMQEYFKIKSMQLYSIDIKSYILKKKLSKRGLKGWPSLHGFMNKQDP